MLVVKEVISTKTTSNILLDVKEQYTRTVHSSVVFKVSKGDKSSITIYKTYVQIFSFFVLIANKQLYFKSDKLTIV